MGFASFKIDRVSSNSIKLYKVCFLLHELKIWRRIIQGYKINVAKRRGWLNWSKCDCSKKVVNTKTYTCTPFSLLKIMSSSWHFSKLLWPVAIHLRSESDSARKWILLDVRHMFLIFDQLSLFLTTGENICHFCDDHFFWTVALWPVEPTPSNCDIYFIQLSNSSDFQSGEVRWGEVRPG
jgi:hypothetical protein